MIVMMAHLSGNKLAVGVDHILYGWVFFGIIIFVMFLIGSRWAQPEAQHTPASSTPSAPARGLWSTAVAAAVVVSLPPLAVAAIERAEGAATPPVLELPARLAGGWVDDGAPMPSFVPVFANPSLVASRVYSGKAGLVGVHVAYVRGQSEQRKLATAQHLLVAMRDPDWSLPQGGSRDVDIGKTNLRLRTAEILGRERRGVNKRPRLVVWRMYWVDGRWITSDVEAKLLGGLARLRGRGDEGALLVLYADQGTRQASDAALAAFVKDNLGLLDGLLEGTRGRR
jgi:EpsI family protein